MLLIYSLKLHQHDGPQLYYCALSTAVKYWCEIFKVRQTKCICHFYFCFFFSPECFSFKFFTAALILSRVFSTGQFQICRIKTPALHLILPVKKRIQIQTTIPTVKQYNRIPPPPMKTVHCSIYNIVSEVRRTERLLLNV